MYKYQTVPFIGGDGDFFHLNITSNDEKGKYVTNKIFRTCTQYHSITIFLKNFIKYHCNVVSIQQNLVEFCHSPSLWYAFTVKFKNGVIHNYHCI